MSKLRNILVNKKTITIIIMKHSALQFRLKLFTRLRLHILDFRIWLTKDTLNFSIEICNIVKWDSIHRPIIWSLRRPIQHMILHHNMLCYGLNVSALRKGRHPLQRPSLTTNAKYQNISAICFKIVGQQF